MNEDDIHRFNRDASIGLSLKHKNIVRVFDQVMENDRLEL